MAGLFGNRDSNKTETTPTAFGASTPSPAEAVTSSATTSTPAVRPAGLFTPGGANSATAAAPSFASANADTKNAANANKQSTLTVGPNIKLKGVEITDCDVLFIEGVVEATLDAKLMQISGNGSFNGTAHIDVAEIHGTFDGDLTVREKLTIFSTGKVTGKIRYGKLVVEEGANISGEISATPSA